MPSRMATRLEAWMSSRRRGRIPPVIVGRRAWFRRRNPGRQFQGRGYTGCMVGEERTTGGGEPIVPRWIALAFVALTVAMAPWIAWLAYELPERAEANHWDLAWAGFDAALAVALGATGYAIIK